MLIILAAQMWLLGRILPLVIGDLVEEDDPRWDNFLTMMKIVDLLFAPTITIEHLERLATLIEGHHYVFTQIYPTEKVIPKMHFMVHMPRLMQRYVNINHATKCDLYIRLLKGMAHLFGTGQCVMRQNTHTSRHWHIL